MAKISRLPDADHLTGDEQLPIVQGGETRGATMTALRTLITPFLQYWYKGDKGAAGTSDNTYTPDSGGLAAFKASDIARATASLVGIAGVSDGRFNWRTGNFLGLADDVNIIAANAASLTVGAWVRETGAVLYSHTFPTLAAAMAALMATGGTLVISTNHAVSNPIYVTAVAGKSYSITATRSVSITYTGAITTFAITVRLAGGNDVTIDGPITFDANFRSAAPIAIDGEADEIVGAARGRLTITGATFKNAKVFANTGSGSLIRVGGGFEDVRIVNNDVVNCTRAAGAVPDDAIGAKGSVGIQVNNAGPAKNPKRVYIAHNRISTITTEDPVGSIHWTDCDGILLFQSAEEGCTFVIEHNDISDYVGRGIKVFSPNTGGGVTRNNTLTTSIQGAILGAIDIDHQHGDGEISGNVLNFSGSANAGPVPRTPFAMATSYIRGPDNPFKAARIVNNVIKDGTGVPKLRLVAFNYGLNDTTPRQFLIENLTDTGSARTLFSSAALGFYGPARVELRQIDCAITQAALRTDDTTPFLQVKATQLRNRSRVCLVKETLAGGPSSLLWGDWEGDETVVGFSRYTGAWRGNAAFTNGFRGRGGGVEAAPAYGTSEVAGRVAIPPVTLADGATWTGPAVGLFEDNAGDFTVAVKLLGGAQGEGRWSTLGGSTTLSQIVAFPTALVEVGSGSAPGTAGKFSIWKDGPSQLLKVQNLTGSPRTFSTTYN